MGSDAGKQVVLQDKLGRILIGSDSLLVFDGQSWSSHAKPSTYSLLSLVPGQNGILWATTVGDLGYFREESLGVFQYHSLVPFLPESARQLPAVWGVAPLGPVTYFIAKDQLLRWDGKEFQVTPFPAALRLTPLKCGGEFWFHHLETGLYQLTEAGPQLKVPAAQLGTKLVIGLIRDQTGLITVSNEGLIRPGNPVPFSSERLNQYLSDHRLSAVSELPDGNLLLGTVSGGLVLTSRSGVVLRIWADSSSGLPGRVIGGLATDASGEVFGTGATDFFHFPATGDSTVFNSLNGLKGQVVSGLTFWKSKLYAATQDGAYRQEISPEGPARFQALPELPHRYDHMLACEDGLLLSGFGGVYWFDGTAARNVYKLQANGANITQPARTYPDTFYVSEVNGLARLVRHGDGSFTGTRFLELPDSCASLYVDIAGKLWLGMIAKGAFEYDSGAGQIAPLLDPVTAKPIDGQVLIAGNATRLLFFAKNRVLQTGPQGGALREVPDLPPLTASVVTAIPESEDVFVVYQQAAGIHGPRHGTGVLSFAADGTVRWREFDLRSLDIIGSIRTATFAAENGHPVLWLGGMQGILRLDYDKISTLAPPAPPILKVMEQPAGPVALYPYKDHRVRFQLFTPDYIRNKDLLFQSRLGTETREWSAPSARRSFEFTSLSEGEYRFEARAVNTAGQVSPPTAFTFRILPPWYRSSWAFAGYAVALGFSVFGYIRIRERRARARNQELETLVEVRTAELVKASAAKDEFLAGVSHEIRNPMNGVIGIAENFRTEGLDAESRRKFSLLRQCASHLSSLLEDILDFSKVQAGAIELDPKPFDLPELVESVAAITRADSEKYGVPVELAVSPAVPRELVGDARRIRQILINFVSNALKFSGRGQVSVTVWCKSLGLAQTEVIFAVSDEGPGISPEEQKRLFTRFERGAAAQKGRVPGTGLGLALCKGLAEKMGGRIWLESELGQGSCFYFSAPFAIAAAPAEPAAAAPAPAPAGRVALVVDDQEYNRIVLADLLQSMGFTVHTAQEGEAALALAGRQNFDVVFLDFNLPGISGVDVARGIRTLPNASAHALILATTAFTTPEKRAQCRDAGMDAFLGKPVTKERLAKALAGLTPVTAVAAPLAASTAKPAAPISRGPADRLGNLRLLARKKGVPLAAELALYLSELDAELAQLEAAVTQADATEAGRCAHLLVGRCGFIYEREMEQTQRSLEAAVGGAHWEEARRLLGAFAAQLADLRIRVAASSGPAAPPA